MEQLTWVESASWRLAPQAEIGIRLVSLRYDAAGLGFNLLVTGNSSTTTYSTHNDKAKAELTFEGQETRVILQPAVSVRVLEKALYMFHLNFGMGFNKNYDSFLTVTDEYGQQTKLSHDNDLFYNLDYSFGFGFGFKYEIVKKTYLALTYNLYRVNTSAHKNPALLDITGLFKVNGYWNNSFGLTLGYAIL